MSLVHSIFHIHENVEIETAEKEELLQLVIQWSTTVVSAAGHVAGIRGGWGGIRWSHIVLGQLDVKSPVFYTVYLLFYKCWGNAESRGNLNPWMWMSGTLTEEVREVGVRKGY